MEKQEYIMVDAKKVTHPGGNFYSFLLDTDKLLKIAYVSTDEKEKGVQRPLSEKRCKDVAKFIDSKKGVFANNIILNLTRESYYDEENENLYIADIEKSAWVVDGQHRLYGFEYAKETYTLLCSAFIDLDVNREAEIFITINKEQKGISASVIYDLIPLIKNADYLQIRSQSLVSRFNEDIESPWYNEIKMLGIGKGLITQATFAKSIEKLIDPQAGPLSAYNELTQYAILKNYFNAFKAIFSEEWGNRSFILTKTVGFAAMCGVFPKVHNLCNSNFKKDNILRILKSTENFDFSSKTRGASTNKVAINNIILELQDALPSIEKETQILV